MSYNTATESDFMKETCSFKALAILIQDVEKKHVGMNLHVAARNMRKFVHLPWHVLHDDGVACYKNLDEMLRCLPLRPGLPLSHVPDASMSFMWLGR